MKWRTEVNSMKRDNLFIYKKYNINETPPEAAVDSSISPLIDCNLCTVQAMNTWLQQVNALTYYRWTLGATTNID